jgi:hypothetical protein
MSFLTVSAHEINLGEENLQNGPNCFNYALHSFGAVAVSRYVSPEEFSEKMELNCAAVTNPTVGDVGVITSYDRPNHTFIYLKENLGIERANLLQGTKVALAPYLDYLNEKRYVDCSDDLLACRWQLKFYHCQKIAEVKPSTMELEISLLANSKDFDYENAVLLHQLLRENRENYSPNLFTSLYDQLDMILNGL